MRCRWWTDCGADGSALCNESVILHIRTAIPRFNGRFSLSLGGSRSVCKLSASFGNGRTSITIFAVDAPVAVVLATGFEPEATHRFATAQRLFVDLNCGAWCVRWRDPESGASSRTDCRAPESSDRALHSGACSDVSGRHQRLPVERHSLCQSDRVVLHQPATASLFYQDADDDGYGDPTGSIAACAPSQCARRTAETATTPSPPLIPKKPSSATASTTTAMGPCTTRATWSPESWRRGRLQVG